MLEINDGDESVLGWSITPAELRSQEKFKSLTDAEAEHIITSLVRLAVIAYNAN